MSSDVINLVIEEGRQIIALAVGRPAVILAVSVGTGVVIIARGIYLKSLRSNTGIKKS